MRLVRRLGWSGHPQPDAVFIPLVVVPISGAPSSSLSGLDYGARALSVFAEFQGPVARPTVIQVHDLQLLEGIGEHPDGDRNAALQVATVCGSVPDTRVKASSATWIVSTIERGCRRAG
jgi:hypothetical protein